VDTVISLKADLIEILPVSEAAVVSHDFHQTEVPLSFRVEPVFAARAAAAAETPPRSSSEGKPPTPVLCYTILRNEKAVASRRARRCVQRRAQRKGYLA